MNYSTEDEIKLETAVHFTNTTTRSKLKFK